jgi:hypothetical protein
MQRRQFIAALGAAAAWPARGAGVAAEDAWDRISRPEKEFRK